MALLALGVSSVVTVLAVQVRKQEQQRKRERPDDRSNPRPDFDAAPSALSIVSGEIDRNDRTDHQQSEGHIHDASSDAASRQA